MGGRGVMGLGVAGVVIFSRLPPVRLRSVRAGVVIPELAAGRHAIECFMNAIKVISLVEGGG
jgi:hypothetical protein